MHSHRLALVLSTVLLATCGQDVITPDRVPLDSVPPVLTPLPAMSFTAPAGGSARLDFDGAEAGTIFAVIDWTHGANNVVAVITGRGCHNVNDALGGRCIDGAVNATRSTCVAKPRVTRVSYYQPLALRLWIANTGTTAESGVVAMTHCKDGPDCGASGSCGRCTISDPPLLESCRP